MNRPRLGLLAALVLSACSSTQQPAPIVERLARPAAKPSVLPAVSLKPTAVPAPSLVATDNGQTYVVKKGDTLFRIALDHGLAYRELALWNNLVDVNDIKVDQVLRLTSPDEAVSVAPLDSKITAAPIATAVPLESHLYPKALRLPYSEQALAGIPAQADGPALVKPVSKPVAASQPKPLTKPASVVESTQNGNDNVVEWILPTTGKVLRGYSESSKGIDISGKVGQPVVASSSGKVVYSGSGLQGYGNLVIIKHNKELLSVYAHNKKLLVTEGDTIKKGEKIAEMGNSDADQVKLHFEIRRFGKPVDPTKFITVDKP